MSTKPDVDWFETCSADSCTFKFTNLVNQLNQRGFIEVSLDSVVKTDSLQTAYWFIGEQYKWGSLNNGNVPKEVLAKAGIRSKNFNEFSFPAVQQAQQDILTVYENIGYPFANIQLSNFSISDNETINAEWLVDTERLVTIDSVTVKGTAKINNRFLTNYLEIGEGDAYSEEKIREVSRRISELPFLKEIRKPYVEFKGEKAKVRTFLNKQQASKFDFVIGILPQNDNDKGIRFTGDGLIQLVNPFGMGEELKIKYSGYPGKSRELNARIQYPYLPLLPIGVDAKFNIYLQDTIYRTTDAYLGLRYNLGGTNFIQFYYENRSTALLSFNEQQLQNNLELPDILDIVNSFYGFQYQWQKLDYRLNPLKGWDININTAFGTKKIKRNAQIMTLENPNDENFSYGSLYDSLNLRNLQIKTELSISKFWKLGQVTTLLTKWRGAVLRNVKKSSATNRNIIHENEQYRIGGNQLLRGFDEQSIQADMYHVITMEFRYLLSRNSNAFLFTDIGNRSNLLLEKNDNRLDFPYGFGIGVNFETKAGIFGMSYALGAQQGNPIQFKTAKIHFGYQNYF